MWRLATIENGRITKNEVLQEEDIDSYFEFMKSLDFIYENVDNKDFYKKYKSTQFEDLYFEFTCMEEDD